MTPLEYLISLVFAMFLVVQVALLVDALLVKRRIKRTRKLAAKLWCIHHHIGEYTDPTEQAYQDNLLVYREEELFPLLKSLGYPVADYIDNLSDKEIVEACAEVHPQDIGITLMMEEEEEAGPEASYS